MQLSRFAHEPTHPLAHACAALGKRLLLLPRSLRLKEVRLEGAAPAGEPGCRLCYIGEGESLAYLRGLHFERLEREEVQAIPLWALRGRIAASLSWGAPTLVELNRLLAPALPAGGYLTFPWVRQRVRLGDAGYLERKGSIEATFGRKVRRNRYTCRTTRDEREVTAFYHSLYVPYIESRFADVAHLRSIGECRAAARSGFLLQVFDGDLWVSGALCRVRRGEVTALAFGLRPEYGYHLQRGALSAAYYFVFRWPEEYGLRTVDLLRSRPHAGDGVFEHKRRWGARPEADPWPHTCIRVYIPPRAAIPAQAGALLVWNGGKFVELRQALGATRP